MAVWAGQVQADIIDSYFATAAMRDSSVAPYSGGHAVWLPGEAGGSRFVFEGNGLFDLIDLDNDNVADEARLHGTVVSLTDASRRWEVDMWFTPTTVGSGGPKLELYSSAYVAPFGTGGPIDPSLWDFYTLDESRSVLTGLSANTGITHDLEQRPTDGRYPFQTGIGASGKNDNYGMSGWFGTPGNGRHWDVNIDLEQVPAPGAAVLAVMGLSAVGLRRKKR